MDHEDNNTQFENLMDNLQIASGAVPGVGGVVGGEEFVGISTNIGGKFEEEHDDEEEWKYKEVQQSEKQYDVKAAAAAKLMAAVEEVGNGIRDVGEMLMGQHDEYSEVGNDVINAAATNTIGGISNVSSVDEEDVEIIRNDGDFSTTSNTTSTAGEDDDLLRVEMKIEAAADQIHQQQHFYEPHNDQENIAPQSGREEETEEEEPSSLATNGTSSLSENPPPQQYQQQQQQQQLQQQEHFDQYDDFNNVYNSENKENAAPGGPSVTCFGIPNVENSADLSSELHSQLNPDAMEFVPTFSSNPASPVSPIAVNPFENLDGEPHPTALPRQMLNVNDDVIAESPRKGLGNSLDEIALPGENEFEHEAARRPHELEHEDDLIGNGALHKEYELLPHAETVAVHDNLFEIEETTNTTNDILDFKQDKSPSEMIDHGPETSVDLDIETVMQPTDVMQKSIYLEEDSPIEDILNTVQPLPTYIETDSLNNSFNENMETSQVTGEKELLNVEEKEHVSHSPSTEEMQMNLINEMHSSAKDIAQIPIDMDSAATMQESVYMEHTSADSQQQHSSIVNEESFLADSTAPFDGNVSMSDTSFEYTTNKTAVAEDPISEQLLIETEFIDERKMLDDDATTSPYSTEEKHLVEETKEQTFDDTSNIFGAVNDFTNDITQQMVNLHLGNDGNLTQVEDVAQFATTIAENPFDAAQDLGDKFNEVAAFEEAKRLQQQQAELESDIRQFEQNYHHDIYNEQTHEDVIPQTLPEEVGVDVMLTEPVQEAPIVEDIIQPVCDVAPITAPMTSIDTEPIAVEAPHIAVVEEEEAVSPVMIDTTTTPTIEESTPTIEESTKPTDEENSALVTEAAAAVAAATAIAATTLAAAAIITKKSDTSAKKLPGTSAAGKTATTAKPKVATTKKPTTKPPTTAGAVTAKTATTTAAAARPRTAPAKVGAEGVDKKPIAAVKLSTTSVSKKPITATSTTARATTKPATTTARPATATKTAAPRTTASSTTTASSRKTISSRPAAGSTATTAAPTKPTSLGLPATAKPKMSSPRSTVTSQLRKTAPAPGATTAAKSPTKSAPTTNGVHGKTSSSVLTSGSTGAKSGTTLTTTTTTTTAKTFKARPAPKTTSTITTTTTTTRRSTVTSAPTTSSTTKTTTNSSTTLRKISPAKHLTTTSSTTTTTGAAGNKMSPNKLSPVKSASAAMKLKTKEVTKTASTTKTKTGAGAGAGAGVGLKQKQTLSPKANGTATATAPAVGADKMEPMLQPVLEPSSQQLNGDGGEELLHLQQENGTHNEAAGAENGIGNGLDSTIGQPAAAIFDA